MACDWIVGVKLIVTNERPENSEDCQATSNISESFSSCVVRHHPIPRIHEPNVPLFVEHLPRRESVSASPLDVSIGKPFTFSLFVAITHFMYSFLPCALTTVQACHFRRPRGLRLGIRPRHPDRPHHCHQPRDWKGRHGRYPRPRSLRR